MRLKWFFGTICTVTVMGLFGLLFVKASGSRERNELNEELARASAEGMPTSWQEFAATIKPAKPEENAGPLYKALQKRYQDLQQLVQKDRPDPQQLDNDILLRPSPAATEAAKSYLAAEKDNLRLLDKASALPRCWFNRDWSKGPAVLMPEFAYMKMGARTLMLRGSLEASEGHADLAIRDDQRVLSIAKQAGEEGLMISRLVDVAIFAIGVRHLALWAFVYPDNAGYREALDAALADWPKVDLQKLHRSDYIDLRAILELSKTAEGRKDLGLREDDISIDEKFIPLFVSRSKADVRIAHDMRLAYEAYKEPVATRIIKLDAANDDLQPALVAYPTGADIYSKLSMHGDHVEDAYDLVSESKRLQYVALSRALASGKVAKRIKTNGLASPFDGTPLDYSYDGHQVTITVSCPDKDIDFKPFMMPSESELTPAKPKSKAFAAGYSPPGAPPMVAAAPAKK